MDNITSFYKSNTTADHQSYNRKRYHYWLAHDDRYLVVSGYLNKYLTDKKGLKILDVACGTGIYEIMLDKKIKDDNFFVGIDVSGPHVEINKEKKTFNELVEHDINNGLPFSDGEFDVIVLSEIIEHLREPEKIINECYRVLKKGGILVLTTPNISSWQIRLSFLLFGTAGDIDYGKNFQHIRFFSKKTIKDIFNKIFGKKHLIYERSCGTLFFYPDNFPFFLPMPRFVQKIFSYLFPNIGSGFFKVYVK